MKELTTVQNTVISALQAAGMTALGAFPTGRAKAYPGAVASVSIETAEGGALGFCNYLGEIYDPQRGTVREVYGKQLEAVIQTEIRGGDAAVCERGCETASEVLLGGLPAGIRAGELSWEGLSWEKETGMFLRRGKLRCRAIFVAKNQEDGETFLDFQLKGVLNR